MKERPILFSAPMVRALLAGTKTQTRRVVKPHRADDAFVLVDVDGGWWPYRSDDGESNNVDGMEYPFACPYGTPGDRLWVKETWAYFGGDQSSYHQEPACVWYRANDIGPPDRRSGRWRPSIFMPRWASRITLEVTGVRVERLQDISEADAIAEGISQFVGGWICRETTDEKPLRAGRTPQESYRYLWESINGAGSWDANSWVWVVAFKRLP